MMIFILAFLVFLVMSAFFSGYEVGLISLDRLNVEREAKEGGKKEKIAQLLKKPESMFGTTLIGTNIALVMISALTVVFWEDFHIQERFRWSEETGTLLVTGLVLVFGEIIPKAVFRDTPTPLVHALYPVFALFHWLFRPLIFLVGIIRSALIKLFHLPGPTDIHFLTREDFNYMLTEGQDDDELMEDQREMLEEVFEFKELRARNVMIPRTDFIAIEKNTTIEEVIELARNEGFTRYPVYDEDLDHVIGILIVYDLIQYNPDWKTAADVMRDASFVPENMDVHTLLKEMKTKHKSMMIVVDSYGGTAGLVTVEDILEEIVGDIEDEYDAVDEEDEDIEVLDENNWIVRGFVDVEDMNDEFDLELPKENGYETIAGLIIHELGRIPVKNQNVTVGNVLFRMLNVSKRKIIKVKMTRLPKVALPSES